MLEISQEKVMDRKKIASTLDSVFDVSIELLNKDKFEPTDHTKIKVIRTLGSHINSAVAMVQQETAMVRAAVVVERMKQLGYNTGATQVEG